MGIYSPFTSASPTDFGKNSAKESDNNIIQSSYSSP